MAGCIAKRSPPRTKLDSDTTQEIADELAQADADYAAGNTVRGEDLRKGYVESTSDYWRIWYYLLEAAGLSVQLVNARDVKNVPGRPKSDKLDAVCS